MSSVLGIGWLQPDGSCEFRLNLEFPTPPTPVDYVLTIGLEHEALTTSWRIPSTGSTDNRFNVKLDE